MTIYAWIILALHLWVDALVLFKSDADLEAERRLSPKNRRLASVIGTVLAIPILGRILGWW
jgi:hypothetical protein